MASYRDQVSSLDAERVSPRADTSFDEVILVNENDRVIGSAPKLLAHQRGLRHRAISVIVHDRQNRLLLHKRTAAKYHSAGRWTNTCCSHPRPEEHIHDAPTRRLAEEMGIASALTPLFMMEYRAEESNSLVEHEIVHVFGGTFDGAPNPDPHEVSDWCWKALAEIAHDIDERPEAYTILFRKFCRDFRIEIINRMHNSASYPR